MLSKVAFYPCLPFTNPEYIRFWDPMATTHGHAPLTHPFIIPIHFVSVVGPFKLHPSDRGQPDAHVLLSGRFPYQDFIVAVLCLSVVSAEIRLHTSQVIFDYRTCWDRLLLKDMLIQSRTWEAI